MDELLYEFIVETREHLAVLERDLVALKHAPANRVLIDDIFRNVHSIKGTCCFLGLKRLESVLHTAETTLEKLRDDALPVASIAIGVLAGTCDQATTIVAALAQNGHEPQASDVKPVDTRRQPIGQAWARLPRMLRDLGRDLGKKIELKLEGGEIELDRDVLGLVKDAFIHLLRNAADHGIETPDERRRAGKVEIGTVTLSARREGDTLVVTLDDDGRGIDPERVRTAIRGGGLATDAELDEMSERQLLPFIFHPGLTTASQVTTISGRGIGLDVVRCAIEKIGGAVDVESQLGRGTRVTIKLPRNLAIGPVGIAENVQARRGLPPRRAAS